MRKAGAAPRIYFWLMHRRRWPLRWRRWRLELTRLVLPTRSHPGQNGRGKLSFARMNAGILGSDRRRRVWSASLLALRLLRWRRGFMMRFSSRTATARPGRKEDDRGDDLPVVREVLCRALKGLHKARVKREKWVKWIGVGERFSMR